MSPTAKLILQGAAAVRQGRCREGFRHLIYMDRLVYASDVRSRKHEADLLDQLVEDFGRKCVCERR